MTWEIYLTDEVNDWLDHRLENDADSHRQVVAGVEALADAGPNLGRPLVDRIKASALHNLKDSGRGRAAGARSGSCSCSIHDEAPSCSWRATRPTTGMPGTDERSRMRKSCTRST